MPAAANPTRRERVEQRESSIVAAARKVFTEQGFDGAKMVEIARRANVAEGTLYLYFRNKNALLLAVVARFYTELTTAAVAGVGRIPDTFGKLEFLARHHLLHCLDEWRVLESAIGLYRYAPDYVNEGHYKQNKAYVAVFDGVVLNAISQGEVRDDVELWVIRDLFYGSLEYSARTQMLRGRPDSIDTIVDSLITMIRLGIAAESNKERPAAGRDLEAITRRLEIVADRLERSG